ncbi:MAG: hypothetical protein IPG96_01615 [Proteobacteria bacterium]|nr:hypothetical protein [Pseudomonadota bacterium]
MTVVPGAAMALTRGVRDGEGSSATLGLPSTSSGPAPACDASPLQSRTVLGTAARAPPSCHAEVQAEVRLQCQIACQEQKFEVCESELVGGCQTDCRSRDGALFCDNQFVDAGDNLKQCITALQNLDITVEGDVTFSASGGCGLAASKTPAPWTALGLLGLLALVRRRRVRR